MSKTIASHAEPAMIVWCRERAGVTEQEVADKLGLAESEVILWEYGNESPTLAQLKALAKFLRFPTAVFYLPEPPQWQPLRDFRRLPSSERGRLSSELAYWTRIALGRQEWLAEYFQSQGREPLSFVGSSIQSESPTEVGKRLRALLGVSIDEQKSLPNKEAAFRFWRSTCESAGVSVFVSRKVPLSDMRGFALSHNLAPVVVVNDQDEFGGRIFTLMHEMAHVMLNISGISDRPVVSTAKTDEEKIEVFCNAVAAEALVPGDHFRVSARQFVDDYGASLLPLSELYRVSQEVIARRLLEHGFITRNLYERLLDDLNRRASQRRKRKKKEVRIKRARVVLATVGRSFGRAVLAAYQEEEITGPEVSDLLDMKIQFLPEFEKQLFGE